MSLGFLTRSDSDRTVYPQKMPTVLEFWMDFTMYVAKSKTVISCVVTAQLICVFVFTYVKSRFSHDTAQMTPVIFIVKREIYL